MNKLCTLARHDMKACLVSARTNHSVRVLMCLPESCTQTCMYVCRWWHVKTYVCYVSVRVCIFNVSVCDCMYLHVFACVCVQLRAWGTYLCNVGNVSIYLRYLFMRPVFKYTQKKRGNRQWQTAPLMIIKAANVQDRHGHLSLTECVAAWISYNLDQRITNNGRNRL